MARYQVSDEGSSEIYETESSQDAAQQYVDGGNWVDEDTHKTVWITVAVSEVIGEDEDGEPITSDGHESITITIEPPEPKCTDGEKHDWQEPIGIVGGCEENPGVYGHGGGVTITTVCMNCGTKRVYDTWAQNPANGEQGLESMEYEEGFWANEVAALKEQEA